MATKLWVSASSTDWNVAGNWSPSGVPANGDDVYFRNSSINVDTTLNQSAVTLNSLHIDQSYTGTIGTSSAYLQIGATTCVIGAPSGVPANDTGSPRIKIDFGSVATAVTVINTAASTSSVDSGLEPFRFIGTNAGNTLAVQGGTVGVATTTPAAVATLTEASISGDSSVLNLGIGCTLTTVNQNSGSLSINSNVTTLNQSGGSLTTQGAGTITTANIGGSATLNSTGTITTLNVSNAGKADFSQYAQPRTVTTCNCYFGGNIDTDNGNPLSITFTNGIKLQQCQLADVDLSLGRNFTIALS